MAFGATYPEVSYLFALVLCVRNLPTTGHKLSQTCTLRADVMDQPVADAHLGLA